MERLENAVVGKLLQIWRTRHMTAANLVTTFADLDPDTKLGAFLIDQLA